MNLKHIPKVDAVCAAPCFAGLAGPLLTEAVRSELMLLREALMAGAAREIPPMDEICRRTLLRLERESLSSLRPVVNATGVILHTNLGRACLSESAAANVLRVATAYSTLEYDPEEGSRGSRNAHVEALLKKLTGAEAAMAVNNNAAAVLLTLSALTKGREVIISRGELVEIGGSFRVPEVMEQSGAALREVGSTNKTHPGDYEKAITPETAALLKVHPSNFRVVGFTADVPLKELVAIGRRHGLPVIVDLGSGLLLPGESLGLRDEPNVPASIAAGADIVTFSGDKLLGGPQAGLIAGKEATIARLKRHPLARAVRIDKLSLAALEATLRAYLEPARACRDIPVLAMLSATPEQLRAKAERLLAQIATLPGCEAVLCKEHGEVGGGAVPGQALASYSIALTPLGISTDELGRKLRQMETPIVGRIFKDRYLLDARTVFEADFAYIAAALHKIFPEA